MGNAVEKVFADPEVNREGLNFLDRLLHSAETHEAGNMLLVNVLSDNRFIEGSNIYGTELIEHVLQQPVTREQCKQLVIRTLQHESVRQEVVNVLNYIAVNQQTEDIVAQILRDTMLREDIRTNLT